MNNLLTLDFKNNSFLYNFKETILGKQTKDAKNENLFYAPKGFSENINKLNNNRDFSFNLRCFAVITNLDEKKFRTSSKHNDKNDKFKAFSEFSTKNLNKLESDRFKLSNSDIKKLSNKAIDLLMDYYSSLYRDSFKNKPARLSFESTKDDINHPYKIFFSDNLTYRSRTNEELNVTGNKSLMNLYKLIESNRENKTIDSVKILKKILNNSNEFKYIHINNQKNHEKQITKEKTDLSRI